MNQLVAFVYRTGTGPARTMKLSMLASGASEHRLAFADMDQQRRTSFVVVGNYRIETVSYLPSGVRSSSTSVVVVCGWPNFR
jgi:hypothetical protein